MPAERSPSCATTDVKLMRQNAYWKLVTSAVADAAGMEAGPTAALLPAADSRHSAGLRSGIAQAAPGSAGHTGALSHSLLPVMLKTGLL